MSLTTMIQIIGLREEGGRLTEHFTDKHWCPDHITDIYTRPHDVLAVIPESDRIDLFFTTHHVTPGRHREFVKCDAFTFEVNELKLFNGTLHQTIQVLSAMSDVFGVSVDLFGAAQNTATSLDVVMSLNPAQHMTTLLQVEEMVPIYKDMCTALQIELRERGFLGAKVNKKAWGIGKLLRLPGSYASTKEGGMWSRDSWAALSVVT